MKRKQQQQKKQKQKQKRVSREVRKQLYIHDDIAFSILSKLPIKSFKRFESVCKSWSLLFDDPIFMNAYRKAFLTKDHPYYEDKSILLHRTFSSPNYYYWEDTFEFNSLSGEKFQNRVKLEWPSIKLDRQKYKSGFNIIGSAHGTLCLLSVDLVHVVLWNPSRKILKCIPPGSKSDFYVRRCKCRKFGYDRVNDDYKVLCLIKKYTWEIYSLRSNSWRKLDVDDNMHNLYFKEISAAGNQKWYMDGLSHWLCKPQTHEGVEHGECLLSFDWSKEVFIITPTPSNTVDYLSISSALSSHLVLLNGSIALAVVYRATTTIQISILGQLGVKESWTKIFFVGPLPCLEYPIGAGKKGDMLFRKQDGGLVWFDLNTQMMEDLGVTSSGFRCQIVIHKESFLPSEVKSI